MRRAYCVSMIVRDYSPDPDCPILLREMKKLIRDGLVNNHIEVVGKLIVTRFRDEDK